jgi:hypothetical protein
MSPSNLPDLAPPTYLSSSRIPPFDLNPFYPIVQDLSNVLLFIFDELPPSAAVAGTACNARSREHCPCFDADRDGHYRHGHYRHAVGHSVIQHAASSDSDAAASLQHD